MNEAFKKLTTEIKAQLSEALGKKETQDFVEKTKAAQDSGSFEVVVSTADIDRQGESVDQNGWDLAFYKMNPVVLWAHDYWALPIGITDEIEVQGDKLVAKGRFAPEEANPFAQQVRRLYDLKIIRATSVGFIPKNQEGGNILAAELLEFSFVPVPANPLALSLSKIQNLGLNLPMLAIKGIKIKQEESKEGDPCTMDDGTEGEMHPNEAGEMVCMPKKAKAAEGDSCTMDDGTEGELKPNEEGVLVCMPKIAEKPEPETEGDYIIIRVKDPDYFDPDSFRTIDISEEQGIKATTGCKKGEYEGGTCAIGVEVQRYLFDKEKWTEAEAQAWIDEHSKDEIPKCAKCKAKGEISDQVNQEEKREQKWQNLNKVWDIFDAFIGVYLDDATPVEDFQKLLDETIALMKQTAGIEKGLVAETLETFQNKNRKLLGEKSEQFKKAIAALKLELQGNEPEEGGKENPHGEKKVETAGLDRVKVDLEIYHATRQILRAVDLAVEGGLRKLKNFTPDRSRKN